MNQKLKFILPLMALLIFLLGIILGGVGEESTFFLPLACLMTILSIIAMVIIIKFFVKSKGKK